VRKQLRRVRELPGPKLRFLSNADPKPNSNWIAVGTLRRGVENRRGRADIRQNGRYDVADTDRKEVADTGRGEHQLRKPIGKPLHACELRPLMAGAHLAFSGACRPPFVEAIRDTLDGFPNLVPPNHRASVCMVSQKGKMVSAPTFSKPNFDRLRTGHRAEPTWRFIPDHDVCPLTDRACALCILGGSEVSSVKFPRLE
jgi:hypothetical protein